MKASPLALALLLGTACAHGPRGGARMESVEAEGWAAWDEARPAESRRAALAEAQRRAVERAAGVRVRGSVRVAGGVGVESVVEARSAGTILRFTPLTERREGGFLIVSIRAEVLVGAPPAGAPAEGPAYSAELAGPAARGLARSLSGRGWRAAEGPGAGLRVEAQSSVARLSDPRLAGFSSFRARVAVTAAGAGLGGGLSAEGEGAGLDADETAAREKALENAAAAAGAALARAFDARYDP